MYKHNIILGYTCERILQLIYKPLVNWLTMTAFHNLSPYP
jgi:hypothetical protein